MLGWSEEREFSLYVGFRSLELGVGIPECLGFADRDGRAEPESGWEGGLGTTDSLV